MCKPFTEWPEILTIPDVIECTGIESADVYRMFHAEGFPLISPEKKRFRMVGRAALRNWINKGVKEP